MKLFFILFFSLLFFVSYSQLIYGKNFGYNGIENVINIQSLDIKTCEVKTICEIPHRNKNMNIAFGPDGFCYLLIIYPNNDKYLHKYDLSNCITLDSVKLPFFGVIKFDFEGHLYIARDYKVNLVNNNIDTLLNAPYAFTFSNGLKYGVGDVIDTSYLYQYSNLDTTSISKLHVFPEGIYGLTVLNNSIGCKNIFLYYLLLNVVSDEYNLNSININTGQKNIVCPNLQNFTSICSKEEFLSSDPECDLLIDLDRDNSSGLFPYDFTNGKVCLKDKIPICDDDVVVHTSQEPSYSYPAIDSIIFTLSGIKNTGYEYLSTNNISNDLLYYQLNDSSYVLKSIMVVPDSVYRDALKEIFYSNTSNDVDTGKRIIKIVAFSDVKKSVEIQSILYLEKRPYSGRDTTFNYCTELIKNNLSFDLNGDENGIWQPSLKTNNVFNSDIDSEGEYFYITNNEVCGIDTAIVSFLKYPPIQASLPNDTSLCKGESITVDINADYKVKWNDGSVNNTRQLIIGDYIAQITDNNLCVTIDSINISQSSTKISVSKNIDLCFEEQYVFEGTVYKAGQSFSYTAPSQNSCDSIVNVNLKLIQNKTRVKDTLTCDNKTIVYQNNLYQIGDTINQLVNNPNGCDSLILIVYKQSEIENLTLEIAKDTLCVGDVTTLEIKGGIAYTWNTGATQNRIYGGVGFYEVSVTDKNFCTRVLNKTITSYPPINFEVYVEQLDCETHDATIEIFTDESNDVIIDGKHESKISNLKSGNYSIMITDKNNCSSIDSVFIEPLKLLQVITPEVLYVKRNLKTKLDYTSNKNIIDIESDFAGIQLIDNQIYITSESDTSIYIVFTDQDFCAESKLVHIVTNDVIDNLQANIIKPGSGVNEIWNFILPKNAELLTFTVFDRWGNKIFHSANIASWDGKFNGNMINDGVYLYEVKYILNGTTLIKRGDITVLK